MAEYLKSEADALKALEDSLAEIPGEYEALLEELTEEDKETFNSYLEAAKVQGFQWTKKEYEFCDEAGRKTGDHVIMSFNENDFLTLAQRYKELASSASDEPGGHEDMMYDLSGYLVEIDTGVIDADYMNSRFVKYLKMIRQQGTPGELIEQAKAELHKTFATLTQEEQKYANIFLHDTERGDVIPELKICDMNRIAYQQLLNDYAEYHERQTTMDFHHQLKNTHRILVTSVMS